MFARNPDYRAGKGIGIAPDRAYRITRIVHEAIAGSGLPPAGERLLHVLIHEACKEKDRRVPSRGNPLGGRLRLPCRLVRERLGLVGSTDNRAILQGLEEMNRCGRFADVELLQRGVFLEWAFEADFQQKVFADDAYALFDLDDLRTLDSPLKFWLHRRLGLVWRMRRPSIEFTVTDLLKETGCPRPPLWSAVSRQFIDALHKISRREDAGFLLFGHWEGELSGIDRITVRITHAQTEWQKRVCNKAPLSMKKAYLVDPTRRLVLTSRKALSGLEPFKPSGPGRSAT